MRERRRVQRGAKTKHWSNGGCAHKHTVFRNTKRLHAGCTKQRSQKVQRTTKLHKAQNFAEKQSEGRR